MYNHSIIQKEARRRLLWVYCCSFGCSWLSYFHHTNLLWVDVSQPSLCFKAATQAAHTSLECAWSAFSHLFNLHKRKLRPTSIRHHQPACLPVLSLPSKPATWLTLMAISYVRPTSAVCFTRCVYYQICIAVWSCVSRVTCLLDRTFIYDSKHKKTCLVLCILLGLQPACSHCSKSTAGSILIKVKWAQNTVRRTGGLKYFIA